MFPRAVSTLSAVTFYGFSYVFYNEQTVAPFSGSVGIKLQLRTFAPNAVVLLLTSVDSNVADYYGIFVTGGKLQWHVVSGGVSVSVESLYTYNTGRWFEVTNSFSTVKSKAK